MIPDIIDPNPDEDFYDWYKVNEKALEWWWIIQSEDVIEYFEGSFWQYAEHYFKHNGIDIEQ